MSFAFKNNSTADPARKIQLILGKDVRLPMNSIVQCPKLTIGDYSRINGLINIRGNNSCSIGKYCALGYGIHILTSDHHTCYANIQIAFQRKNNFHSLVKSKGQTSIGHNVWIGENVTILPGVSIGDGAVIGAGSVVTKSLMPFSINFGNPCKQHRLRFSEDTISQLQIIQWWDWPEEKIEINANFFNLDLDRFEGNLMEIIN